MRPFCDISRGGPRIGGEAKDETVRVGKRIEPARIAVMAEVPNRQHLVAPLRGQERIDDREIIFAHPAVGQRPWNAFARHRNADGRQQAIILVRMLIMTKLGIEVAALALGQDHSLFPGVGAAGGLGFACRAFLKARFRPGIELIAELSELDAALAGASLVITGEGRLDGQSLHGKTPVGVAHVARRAGVPVIALAGSVGEGLAELREVGIEAAFSLTPGPITLADACARAAQELENRAEALARFWSLAQAAR